MDDQEPELDIRALLGTFRRRGWVVLACIAVFGVGAYLYSSHQPKRYAAVAEVRITDPNADAVFNGVQVKTDPAREVDTQILVVESSEIRTCADQTLGLRAPELETLSVSGHGQTDILLIRAESRNPEVARDGANAVADCYVSSKKAALVSEFQARAVELRKKASDLNDQMTAIDQQLAGKIAPADADRLRSEKSGLLSQKQELDRSADEAEIEASVRSGSVELVDHAELPTTPVSPKPLRDAALAAALGLLVGLGLVFLLERLDDKVKVDRLDRLIGGAPVLGAIPLRGARRLRHHHLPDRPRTLVESQSIDAEAFRTLATSLRFSVLGREKRVIAVTSASVGEGKSTLCANLALALARGGQRVVILSADLRRPSLAEFFGLSDDVTGLTSVLVGDIPLTDAVVPIPDASGLLFLPTGRVPHNPAGVLGSEQMSRLLASLVESGADYVLVDCPPVLPISDTLALVQHVDGVLVVCVPGQTRADGLQAACNRLQQVGAEIIGVVINGVTARQDKQGEYYRYAPSTPRGRGGRDPARSSTPGAAGGDDPAILVGGPGDP